MREGRVGGRRELVLGRSLSKFMRTLGVYSSSGGTQTRLRNQMRRLFNAHVQLIYEDELGEASVSSSVADRTELAVHRVAPTFVLKYNIRTRSLADQGAIEDVLAVENDVVPFDRANVLEQGCGQAFLGDSLRSPRPCDLLACQLVSRRKDHGQVSIIMSVLLDVS